MTINYQAQYEQTCYSAGVKAALAAQKNDFAGRDFHHEVVIKLRRACPNADAKYNEGYKSQAIDRSMYRYR